MTSFQRLSKALRLVMAEYFQAAKKHKPYNSAHEGLGVIYEEFIEVRTEVFKRDHDYDLMMKEAVQLASSSIRLVVDICLKGVQ